MKKLYSKPEIMFESFTLSTNIAGGCEVETDLNARGNCGLLFGKNVIFTSPENGCDKYDTSGTPYDGLCYHNPTETKNLFNS